MALWIGHYEGNPVEWFIVQAKNRGEAIVAVDGQYGQPDEDSIQRFDPSDDAFVLNFRLKNTTEASEEDNPIEIHDSNVPLQDLEEHIRARLASGAWHNVRPEWKNLSGHWQAGAAD
jgi:hypothetical protein